MELYPYQRAGAAWLSSRKFALLCDEPGLGKTVQAIEAANIIARGLDHIARVHVISPASVCAVWNSHIAEWAHKDRTDWCIESYDKAAKRKAHNGTIDVLILDEAHYLKNRKAKRTISVYGAKCDRNGGLASQADNVFLLTGTPVPNNPSELWPHVRALFSESFLSERGSSMSYFGFENRFCSIRIDRWGYRHIDGGRNLAELRERLSPHVLRRRKIDVMSELPPTRFSMLPLTVSQEDVRRIADEARGFDEHESYPPPPTLRRATGVAKVGPMIEWTRDWFDSGGGKLVLFAHHHEVIDRLAEAFPDCCVTITGETMPKHRVERVDRFQTDPDCKIFIGQLQAAGTGITLTAASTAILVESSWVPADNEQAAMRIHRIGQRNACDIRFAHAAGTIDERIQQVALRKMRTIEQILARAA